MAIKSEDVFHERLIAARDHRKMSQQDVARQANLPASSISHFEGGARKPSLDNLRRLANALDVSTDYLLGRTDEIGTAVAAQKLQNQLDKLTAYDLTVAERFIEVLASKPDPKTAKS